MCSYRKYNAWPKSPHFAPGINAALTQVPKRKIANKGRRHGNRATARISFSQSVFEGCFMGR